MAERLFSTYRIWLVLGSAVWWLVGPHPAGSRNELEWIIIAAAAAFALINEFVLRYDLSIARAFPLGTVLADWAIIGSSVWASGGRNSPFQFFILVGVVTTALRVPVRVAILPTLGYVGLSLLFGDLDSLIPDAVLVAVLGMLVAIWSDTMQRLHLAAVRDPLTGVYSRDFGMIRLKEAIARGPFPFVVAAIDLDGFKAVNDVHGHEAGDIVLRQVAHSMISSLRSDDFLCRTGGDEFMVVFSDIDVTSALAIGERLRAMVASSPIRLRDENTAVTVTLSLGLAEVVAGTNVSTLLKAADQAMYEAKKKKNAVVAAPCLDSKLPATSSPANAVSKLEDTKQQAHAISR